MQKITFTTTSHKQILDITDDVQELLKDASMESGLVHLFITHTTACLTTADLDPGTDLDMLDAFEEIIPKLNYRHPHDPSHVGDHIMSSMVGHSVLLPFESRKLILGTWQKVVLVELSGPRPRKLIVNFISSHPQPKS